MTNDEGELEFRRQPEEIRRLAEILLRQHIGERCPDYEASCLVCQRWQALDELLDNPY